MHTIFHQEWWLDAATNGDWRTTEVKRDGKVIASMPFHVVRRHFTTRIGMPPYTRVLGPEVFLPDSKPVTRQINLNEVVAELMLQLPQHDVFRHCLAPESGLANAFVFGGWQVIHDYTFRIAPDAPEATVLQNMHWRTRSHIRQSKGRLSVEMDDDLDQYIRLARAQTEQTNKTSRHEFDVLIRLFEAALRNESIKVLTARRHDGRASASAVLLFDERVLYFWLGARDAAESGSRGYTLLLWEALRFAQSRGLIFDFDGFASPSAAKYLINFGAELVDRPIVMHIGTKFRAFMAGRDIIRHLMQQPVNADQRAI